MVLVEKEISRKKLLKMSEKMYENLVKVVVDIDKGTMIVDGALHADQEAFMLNQGSLQKNLYGINVLFDNADPDTLYLEVVGPGFEVSNLNRGDISPHERLTIKRENGKLKILEREIISQSNYENSANLRYRQIGQSLSQENSGLSDNDLIESGKNFLKKHGYKLLENHSSYQKISDQYLQKILENTSGLFHKLSKYESKIDQFVLSITVFDQDEMVFWDVVLPEHKYGDVKNG